VSRPRALVSVPLRLSLLLALVALAPALGGCAHQAEAPAATLTAFGAALARGDYRGAYALTSSAYRARTSYDAFAAGLGADPAGAKAFGERVIAAAPRVAPRVDVPLELGDTIPLVLEQGRWRIDGPAFDPWGQETPRAALRTLIRALDGKRYDILLRLSPRRYRGALTADKLRRYWEAERREDGPALLGRLRGALSRPIVESGDEAHLSLGPEHEVRFVREDGLWRVDDLD
jgi:hypothetical protein